MNFKIEIDYLNVDNYPGMEIRFEKMARKGWLIHRVYLGIFFLYKKIEPQEFDFSISPYEVETALTRKSKADLEEFQAVSRNVGWDYATKSYDLHIYYKSKDSSAIPIHTDEEEEFNTIEIIAKRYLKSQYFLLVLLIILTWFNIGSIFNSIHAMKDGYAQIVGLLLPLALFLSIVHIFDLRKFLKRNRENIQNGDSLEFNNSQRIIYKFIYTASLIIFLCLIIYSLYSIFILKNSIFLFALIPVIIGLGLGYAFRKIIKPLNKGKSFKLIGVAIMLFLAVFLGSLSSFFNFGFINENKEIVNPNDVKVLSFDHLSNSRKEEQRDLTQNASPLIPQSYDYISISQDDYLSTEYSKVLNESLAKNLVSRYVQQGENRLRGHYFHEIEMAFVEGYYRPYLANGGFNKHDFNMLYDTNSEQDLEETIDQAEDIILQKSIIKDNNLWNLDEVYFLTFKNDEIVIRDGNEVFYLYGLDFSDPSIINQIKSLLNLD